MKIVEGRRKVLKKKLSECKIVMKRFKKKNEYKKKWSIHSRTGDVISGIGCKEWNGVRNEIYKHLPIIQCKFHSIPSIFIHPNQTQHKF